MNHNALRKSRGAVLPASLSCGLLKILRSIGLVLVIGVGMSACVPNTYTWKEEVLLQDGGKLIAERTVVRGGGSEIGQEQQIKEQSLTFTLPSTNERVSWEDKFTDDTGGENFLPMLLEIRKDVAYLVVNSMAILSYNKWDQPNPPYVVFKYQGKTWKRIALEELPREFTVPNLIFSSPDTEARKSGQSIVSAATIRKLYDGYEQPEFKSILRTPIDRWKPRPQNIGPRAPNPVTSKGTIENEK